MKEIEGRILTRIGITTSATFTSKTYVAGATKANMSGAITGDTPEAFVEALHDVNDNHAKDDIESALDYISDAKCEFVKELKYQFSNLEYLEPEIIDFCTRYDVCRDTVKVIAAGYDCVEVTSRMYLNVTLDTKMNDVALHGTYPYVVWLDVTSEPNNADRFESIKKVAKVINSELSRFEVRTGASAFLSEVCEH